MRYEKMSQRASELPLEQEGIKNATNIFLLSNPNLSDSAHISVNIRAIASQII